MGSFRKSVTVTLELEQITFVSKEQSATIDVAARVGPDGQIIGFGGAPGEGDGVVERAFSPSGIVNERVLVEICRRGLSDMSSSWMSLRPCVVVHGANRIALSRDGLARVFRAAGAGKVEWAEPEV